MSRSDLSRLAKVSRQAVSLWFQKAAEGYTSLNIQSKHLRNISQNLGISQDELSSSLPIIGTSEEKALETTILWDRLYPSLPRFIVALHHGELRAIARLVQCYGLFRASSILGKTVWRKFHQYKEHIEPRQREQWQAIWNLQKNLNLI